MHDVTDVTAWFEMGWLAVTCDDGSMPYVWDIININKGIE